MRSKSSAMTPEATALRRLMAGSVALMTSLSFLRADDTMLHLMLRSRARSNLDGKEAFSIQEKKVEWEAKKTAIIICDMWDDHWCKSAADRVAELAGPMNEVVNIARAKGVFIIHSPSSVVNAYKDTLQRQRAAKAPLAKPP